MKKSITIEYQSGDSATYVAYPPDFAKWERANNKPLSEFAGIYDLLFVAHSAMKRESGGKPVKPLDVWMESIVNIELGDDDPKAIQPEA